MNVDCSHEERLAAAEHVLAECFWGDYHFTAEQIVSAAANEDEWTSGLVFGKIVDNAARPSPLLVCLFGRERVRRLLEREEKRTANPRRRTRLLLIRANALGERVDLPQFSWTK